MRYFLIFLSMAGLAAQSIPWGHSHLGEAFDEGPRQRPARMEGIGHVHFPITSKSPEVQQWFDQGIALLHGFWFYEAERTFRWALKLDPDCAMCWWGLSRSTENSERGKQFIREAAKRKAGITERERLYIEAWEQSPGYDFFRGDRTDKFSYAVEKILLRYPDDIEAKVLYGQTNLGGTSRLADDRILKEVIAAAPDHPGAHHLRIHNWNYREGEQALDSAAAYARIAPAIGHAQHMPGHIYSTVGMWNEAAISMDSATRVEARYMRERMIFPFNDWNYGHNRNYLNYILEQLGMERAAIAGAKELLETPDDPKAGRSGWRSTRGQGMWSLARTLVKFERWKELLDSKTIPWGDSPQEQMWKHYCEARAHLALAQMDKAEKSIRAQGEVKIEKDKYLEDVQKIMGSELRGLLHVQRGETLEGLSTLGDAAQKQYDFQLNDNDPPSYPNVVYLALGRAYLQQKSPKLAAEAFEKALDLVRNDGFALAGLVESYTALGETSKADHAKTRLQFVWSDADQPPKFGVTAKDESPKPQRNYVRTSLEKYGPPHWQPYPAPALEVKDASSKEVTLNSFRGKNVVLVFYLGEECPHCLQQLEGFRKRKADFARVNTEIIAVSPSTAKATDDGVLLLSDPTRANAKRFQSYDDFEEIELHSTVLIDRFGRVHWARTGGAPFTDYDFLLKQLARMNANDAASGN